MTVYNYTDLEFSLDKNSINDFIILSTEDAIRQSIKNILLTRIGFYTKYEEPEFGSQLFILLSQKPNKLVALQIRDQVENSLNNYEPRIKVEKISVDFDQVNHAFQTSIYYKIISTQQNDEITISLDVIK